MSWLLGDSRLNETEQGLQHSFMKSLNIKAFFLFALVMATHWWLRSWPQIPMRGAAEVALRFAPVDLPPPVGSPLRAAGAWTMSSDDPRVQGLSGLASDGEQLVAVSDMGFAMRFSPPGEGASNVGIVDLRDGPGPFGRKVNRDAEAVMRDPAGKGWWVAYEQFHSLWRYDEGLDRALGQIDLSRANWRNNKGAEGLAMVDGQLAAFGEMGQEIVMPGPPFRIWPLHTDWMIADAANAPDGSVWLLLRHHYGAVAAIAPLTLKDGKATVGQAWPVPKGLFDNFEGMTIVPKPGGWRFWLVTDDGHRFMARTMLVALDLPRTQENARR